MFNVITYAAAVKKAKKMIDEHLAHLPIATEDSLGAVMVGDNLDITEAGVLSVDTSNVATRSYADGLVSAEATARQSGDTDTLNAAKSYTDGAVGSEATARQNADAETLATAKSYADGIVSTEATARQSADTALESAVGNRVRYDAAQSLTEAQKQQARENIDAVSQRAFNGTDVLVDPVINDTVSGTRNISKYYNPKLSPGRYAIKVDKITSTDTDADTCLLLFMSSGETITKRFDLPRGVEVEQSFTLSESITYINFYASTGYSTSTGDSFSFENFRLWKLSDGADEYINSNIAPVDTSPTQSSHVKNSLFVANSTLYKANDAIAPGDVILPGTNVIETNVAQLLTPITGSIATGDVVNTDTSYARVGEANLYIYPFGLAILKMWFRVTSEPGTTERTFARISVAPFDQVGLSLISQQGTGVSLYVTKRGTLSINTGTASAIGLYHVCVPFPIAPYIT